MWNTSLAALWMLLGMFAIGQEKQEHGVTNEGITPTPNSLHFAVGTAKISAVTPTRALPGAAVAVSGVGFGEVQGNSQVWLGGAKATAQTWSDSKIIALVASGAASGQARVLQNGVFSNGVPLTVSTPHITGIRPGSAGSGTLVTISGIGFGASQDSGTITLGSRAGQVVSWSDAQVIAAVAPDSLTGIVRIQQNGYFSNAISFTVPAINDSGAMVLNPILINMEVGDTRSIQALNLSLRSVTGLAWTSSDPAVVSITSTDPPVLRALTAGHATITGGRASTDVTVSAISASGVGLRPGTIRWSNPGDGSGVNFIEPAYPSTSGVADIFAIMNDGAVLAIDSDGITAWSADASNAQDVIPNFQGGLVQVNCDSSIVTLDGTTGQVVSTFRVSSGQSLQGLAIHEDGEIFASLRDGSGKYSIVGIDPTLGNPKFSVPLPDCSNSGVNCRLVAGPMVGGDQYAYVAYQSNSAATGHLMLLRVDGNGETNPIHIKDFSSFNTGILDLTVNLITNTDKGVLLTWQGQYREELKSPRIADRAKLPFLGMAVTNGTSVNLVDPPMAPNQRGALVPILQADDGSFLGTFHDNQGVENMLAFTQSGNLKWVVPHETPQTAINDGGVIGTSGIKYDANGNVTGQVPLYMESWTYNMYRGSGSIDQYTGFPTSLASSWAFKRWSSPPSHCHVE